MEMHVIGYNHPHDKSFIIDRPNGINNWLFLLIKTPAVFKENGKEIITRENSFILYTDDIPQYYHTYKDNYVDDWFHFSVNQEDKELISKLKIPLNTVTWIGEISELSNMIHNLAYEFYTTKPFQMEMIEACLKVFFIKLSRKLYIGIHSPMEKDFAKNEVMIQVRIRIYSKPQTIPTVKEIAKELSMSESNFQHTYKRIFGVNVKTDVINSRLQRARDLLATTDLTLEEIATRCGYSSAFYMMRQFKQKHGITPTEFRRVL